jgi:hypothetical protein
MTSLSNILTSDPTLDAADRALEAKAAQETPRGYLGMSAIGDSCSRKLWYGFHHAGREAFDAPTLKRFADGHRTEDLVIERLRLVEGLGIVSLTHEGGQIRVTDHGGHFSGHLDGTIEGIFQAPKTRHVLEVKCCGDKTFAKFKKAIADYGEKAALKVFNQTYYAQAQCYMHYTGLTRHYIVVATAGGRDWCSARTEYNAADALQFVSKAKRIIDAQEPPDRISKDPSWWECRYCTFSGICHQQEMPDRSCRTCLHSEMLDEGRWHCQRWGKNLSIEEQVTGCPTHKFLPALVPGEVIKADEKGVTYKLENGEKWYDGE